MYNRFWHAKFFEVELFVLFLHTKKYKFFSLPNHVSCDVWKIFAHQVFFRYFSPYYSYIENLHIPPKSTSFSPTKTEIVVKLLKQVEAVTKILATIQQEHDRLFQRKINYTCRKVKGDSQMIIQVSRNGGEDQVNELYSSNHPKSYLG